MNPKPWAFVDLDDTLFQTHRKHPPTAQHQLATTDKYGQPLSYMQPKQQIFVNWLLQSADAIPVTARSVDALKRVHIEFSQGAICSHGGTIIAPNQQLDLEWLSLQRAENQKLQHLLAHLPDLLQDYAQNLGSIRTWTVQENGLNIYTVAKQNDPEPLFLAQLIDGLAPELSEQCYIHMNGNNLAIIPKHVSKQKAVEFFIQKYDPEQQRAIVGWGDSLSDAGFLGCCDWFGMPKNSQLDQFLACNLSRDHQSKGFLGHA